MSREVVNVEMGLSAAQRCTQCRSQTVSVVVDAGAGRDLPLFVMGEPRPPSSRRVVQAVRQTLRGNLCLNCGLLSLQAKLTRAEIDAYRRQAAMVPDGDERAGGETISPRSPTRVKSNRTRRD